MARKKDAKKASKKQAKRMSKKQADKVVDKAAEKEAELTLESIQQAKAALDSKDVPPEVVTVDPIEPLYIGLPAFRSTKHVEAFQINELVALPNGVVHLIGAECMAVADSAFIDRWRPQAGQYYVKAGERRFCMTAGEFEAEFTAA